MSKLVAWALAVGFGFGAGTVAAAQDFPKRPVNLLVGFSAGSATDSIARFYAQAIGDSLGQPLIIQNRPGASQAAAIHELVGTDRDGHAIMMITGSASSQGPGVRDDLPYKTLEDFVPVAMVATAAGVFVAKKDVPFDDMAGLVAYAKENPGALNYGSSGLGSASNLQLELLKSIAGIDMAHIPYEGSGQIMTALVAGEVDIGLSPIQGAQALVKSQDIKAIAVTGSTRVPSMPTAEPLSNNPDLPGLSVLDPYTYYLIVARAGTPQPVIDKLHAAFNAASATPEATAMLDAMGFSATVMSIDEARSRVEADIALWRKFRDDTGFVWGK